MTSRTQRGCRYVVLAVLCTAAVLLSTSDASALAPYRSTITVDRRSTFTGMPLRFSGAVPSAGRNKVVTLQVALRGAWRNVGTARITPTHRYAVNYAPITPGALRFRLRVAGDQVRSTGASPTVTVTVRRPAPITVTELKNLTLPPSVCDYLGIPRTPHRLVNGRYDFAGPPEVAILQQSYAIGDLDGDGVADGAFSYGCANGVGDKTSDVRVVLAGGRRQMDVALARPFRTDIPIFDVRQEDLNDVHTISISGRRLRATMWWGFLNDGLCCPTASVFGTYAFNGRNFARTQLTRVDDLYRTRILVAALNSRNLARVSQLLTTPAQQPFGDGLRGGGQFTKISCFTTSQSPFHECAFQSANGITYFATWSGNLSSTVAGAIGTASITAAYPGD